MSPSSPDHRQSAIKKYKAAWFIWAAFVFVLHLLPSSALPTLSGWEMLRPDKWVHAGIFAVLAFLVFIRFAGTLRKTQPWLMAGCIGYGLLLETMQGMIGPIDRSPDLFDFYADVFGVAVGYAVFRNRMSEQT